MIDKTCKDKMDFIQELNTSSGKPQKPIKLLSVLGSGGHTTEMMSHLRGFPRHMVAKITYVIASTDQLSEARMDKYEKEQCKIFGVSARHVFRRLPRSREVGQSYITSIWSTLYALIYSFRLVIEEKPDVVVVNGPGTCVPICYAVFVLGFFYKSCPIVFIESFTRVKTISLTGKLLYPIASRFIVQWPQ